MGSGVMGSKESVFITGGAGFIGYHLSKHLLEQGVQVTGLDNCNSYYDVSLKESRISILKKFSQYRFVKADLVDASSLYCLFEEERPSIVVNLGAQAGVRYSIEHPRTYIDSNVIGFFNVLEACKRYPVKHLLFASSSSVYGNQKKIPFAVTDRVDHPISLYAATKKTNELMAYTYSHLYDIAVTGLRFFTVYGPYGRPDMAYFKFADCIRNGKTIRIYNNGDMLRDFTYIDDIVDGIVRMLCSPPMQDSEGCRYKVYNIGNSHPVRLMDFIEILETALGKVARKEYLPMQMGDVYQTYADVSELERDFGFRPHTPLETGLGHFAAWYKEYYMSN